MGAEGADEAGPSSKVYTGTLLKRSAKDPKKFIIECPEAFAIYGTHIQMSKAMKPEGAEIGDTIQFCAHPSKADTTWVEKVKKTKKRKADPDQMYSGTVTKQSLKQPSLYIVECPVVTEWYGIEARLPSKLWPEGLELGGAITFGIQETPTGKPLVAWAEVAEGAAPPEEKQVKKSKKEPQVSAAAEPEAVQPPVFAVVSMKDAEAAVKAWEMDGSNFRGMKLSVVHHPETEDGLKFKVGNVPWGTDWKDLKNHFKRAGEVGFCKVCTPYAAGEVRFHTSDDAEAALGLYGTWLEGAELRVELDGHCQEGTKVRIFGLPIGFSSKVLRQHFEQIADVAHCQVREMVPR